MKKPILFAILIIIILISGAGCRKIDLSDSDCEKQGATACIKESINKCKFPKDPSMPWGKITSVKGNTEKCTVKIEGGVVYYHKVDSKEILYAECSGPSEEISNAGMLMVDARGGEENEILFKKLKDYCSGSLMDTQYNKQMSYNFEYFNNKVLTEKNPKLCEELNYPEKRIICIKDYLSKYIESGVCDVLDDPTTKDFCLAEFAIIKRDPSLCQSTKQPDYCYTQLAMKLPDKELCEKIYYVGIDECYRNVAIITGDSSICRDDYCYLLVAIKNLDDSLCEKIKEVDVVNKQKERCYEYVTELKSDSTLCYDMGHFELTHDCSYINPDYPNYNSKRIVNNMR